jgi:hypothetical protein
MAPLDISSVQFLTFRSHLRLLFFSAMAASLSDMLAVAVEVAKAAGEVSFLLIFYGSIDT